MFPQLIHRRRSSEAATWRTTPKAPLGWTGSAQREAPASLGDSVKDPATAPEGPPLAAPGCHVSKAKPASCLSTLRSWLTPDGSPGRPGLPPDQTLTIHTETTALALCRADSHFQSALMIWRTPDPHESQPTLDSPHQRAHTGASSRGRLRGSGSREGGHTCASVRTCVYMRVCVSVRVCVCVSVYMCVSMCVSACICVYISLYKCMFLCVYMCV